MEKSTGILLNDQGGAFQMQVLYEKAGTLRAQVGGHQQVVIVEIVNELPREDRSTDGE